MIYFHYFHFIVVLFGARMFWKGLFFPKFRRKSWTDEQYNEYHYVAHDETHNVLIENGIFMALTGIIFSFLIPFFSSIPAWVIDGNLQRRIELEILLVGYSFSLLPAYWEERENMKSVFLKTTDYELHSLCSKKQRMQLFFSILLLAAVWIWVFREISFNFPGYLFQAGLYFWSGLCPILKKNRTKKNYALFFYGVILLFFLSSNDSVFELKKILPFFTAGLLWRQWIF